MAEEAAERTEEATPKKRLDARKKGSVAKSSDLTNALVMITMLMVLPGALSNMAASFKMIVKGGIGHMPLNGSYQDIIPYCTKLLSIAIPPFMMIIGPTLAVGLISNFAQVGFILSPESMTPNFNKLNPLKGLKSWFAPTGIFNGFKSLAKALLFGWFSYSTIANSWTKVGNLSQIPAGAAFLLIADLIRTIAIRIVISWFVIAAIDYFLQKKQLDKNLRMSKEEIKQEFKQAESNPEVKAKRMHRMRQMIKNNTRKAVMTADVIVTNPTHFSVAIKYEKGKPAPTVVAKGQDVLAFKIREFAKEFDIPIVPNPPLARALYRQCEIGDYVPRELFQSVAELLAYVYKTVRQVRKSA